MKRTGADEYIAVIVDKDADLKLALQGVLFAAVGTA